MKNKQLSKLGVIHSYLEKPKFRAIVLLPPLTLCFIGGINAYAQTYSNFDIYSFDLWSFIGGTIWLLLSMCFVLWSDYKREKNTIKNF